MLAGALWWAVDDHGDAGDGDHAREDDLAPGVRATLTIRARDVIEDREELTNKDRHACAVRVLGTDPPAVADATRARTVYVWATCAGVGTTTRWSESVAVHLTDPPTVEQPGLGAYNGPDKKRIFPERLWDLVDTDSQDRYGLESEQDQRIRERTSK